MCINMVTHTHTGAHLCLSHTFQSCFSLTERREAEREMQQFAGVELLASVGLVGLSIHVQRQRLSDLLFRWLVGVGTVSLCRFQLSSCVSMCVLLVLSVWCSWAMGSLGLPELLQSLLWQRGRDTISNSPLLLFWSGEKNYQGSRAIKETD